METQVIVQSPGSRRLKASRVTLSRGENIGEHITEGREEIIIILKGEAVLVKGESSTRMKEGDIHHIGEGVLHNVRNESGQETEYVYVVCFC
ncbi:MAG TPA: cupin domain-containing protein [archaeon]|nr:cupin domain-containing protein [archaeon]